MATAKKTAPKRAAAKKTAKRGGLKKLAVVFKPLRPVGGYVAGAWYELKQVRWPDRKATWSLTLAVILFTAFFSVVILALDYAFQYLFKEILL